MKKNIIALTLLLSTSAFAQDNCFYASIDPFGNIAKEVHVAMKQKGYIRLDKVESKLPLSVLSLNVANCSAIDLEATSLSILSDFGLSHCELSLSLETKGGDNLEQSNKYDAKIRTTLTEQSQTAPGVTRSQIKAELAAVADLSDCN